MGETPSKHKLRKDVDVKADYTQKQKESPKEGERAKENLNDSALIEQIPFQVGRYVKLNSFQ